jgi:hypothetical protein
MAKNRIIVETHRIEYENFYILIVPDIAAGHRGRYTVYKIPSSPSRRIKIIGRELPLKFAKKYVKDFYTKLNASKNLSVKFTVGLAKKKFEK